MAIKRDGKNQGRRMAVFQLEDPTGTVRVVVFPDTFERIEALLTEDEPLLVVANLKGDGDHVELLADEVASLKGVEAGRASGLKIVLKLDHVDQAGLEEIREYLLDHPGELPVRFELVRSGDFRVRLVPPPALTVDPTPEVREGLQPLLGPGRSEFEFGSTGARNGGSKPACPPHGQGPASELVN
jgi:DNA polymerase-3 subunit alpha